MRKEGLSIRAWKIASALGLCALGVLVLLLLQSPSSEAGEPQTTASYVDYNEFNCSWCHPTKWSGWSATKHAVAWPTLMSNPGARDYCEDCHATGGGVPTIYPDTGYDSTTNSPTYLQNVTCQACHGPASNHEAAQSKSTIALVLNSTLCGSCHYSPQGLASTHHPTYNEWAISGHNTTATLPNFVKQPACSNCHEAWNAMEYLQTGVEKTVLREADEDAPITWQIACATCHDPHSTGAGGTQLRVPADEICARCHNSEGAVPPAEPHHPMAEMRNNTAGYGIDRTGLEYMESIPCASCHMADNNAGLPNHTFMPNPAACVQCHPSTFPTVEAAAAYIDTVARMTQVGIGGVQPVVQRASELIEQMRGNRTAQDMDALTAEYQIALFNLETVVSDGSNGNHNPALASALLNDALARSSGVVAMLTPPDKVTGVRAIWLANGSLQVSWDPTDASDFAAYRIYVLTTAKTNITDETPDATVASISTTTYWLMGVSNATPVYVYVTAVDADGNEITNTVAGVLATGNLEQVIQELRDQLSGLQDQLEQLQGENDQLTQDVADLRGQVSDLKSQRLSVAIVALVAGLVAGVLVGMLLLSRRKPKAAPEKAETPPQEPRT